MTATIDDIAKTLGEFEALAQKTGEWDGADPVEFSRDGIAWLPVWLPAEGETFPPFARATVRRKGVATPTVMVVAWAESIPADDEWFDLWQRKPMKLFGSFALRSAIRHAFRDVVGELRGPDEPQDGPTVDDTPSALCDWGAEIAAAESVGVLDRLWGQMRIDRARTGAREKAYRERRAELAAGVSIAGPPTTATTSAAWEPVAPPLSEDELIRHHAFFGHPDDETPARPGRTPQDHLPPANRAERRAAAKRKGRR